MSHYVVGLTGGIGSGKTAVSDAFAELGINIIDADICARDVVAIDSPALAEIKQKFGSNILCEDGSLNRPRLRELVFADETKKQWLNSLLHPLIRQRMLDQITKASSAYCVLAVPLLLENKMQAMVNRVLVVDVPEKLQLERAVARDNSQKETIQAIMQSQLDRPTRLSLADDVITNTGTLEQLKSKVQNLHQQYLKLALNPSNT
ncbi:dephospho-CoA kinase [Alteromonas facilis]|uniref:dephospho-CoA kinase n=1 Tax=Alteromonas facilis TaxID=2048004 RepID=UPI000C29450D|nr:dephospho-CoA kinase [Alteromonas facilis]